MTSGTRDLAPEREAEGLSANRVIISVVYVRYWGPIESRSMCGIAGYSLSSESPVERTLAAQALLAGIAERGADAVGYAVRGPGEAIDVTKLRGGASAFTRRDRDIAGDGSGAHPRSGLHGPPRDRGDRKSVV